MNEIVYRCPQCGGNVSFDPGQQALACPYCKHVSPIADLKRAERRVELDFEAALARFDALAVEELRIVSCSACGGETTLAPNVESGACDFCGTAIVAVGPTTKAMKPQYLLPFTVAAADAERNFRAWLKKRWFAPGELKKLARVDEPLKGIYFPFWTYDADTFTRYVGERGVHYTVETTRRNSDGQDETVTEVRTEWYPVAGSVGRAFAELLVPASASLPERLTSRLRDWDLSQAVEYNPAVLSGFKSESYSKDLRGGFEDAKDQMRPVIESDVRMDIGGDEQRIFSMDTQYADVTFKYLQLPVWSLMYRFRKKFFAVLVNGQNGEVTGQRPYSAAKITAAVLFVLGLVGAGVYLYYRYGGS